MKIEELSSGQKVTLIAKIGAEEVSFESVVQETLPKKHMALIDVIRKNDKILTFHAKNLITDLHIAPSDSAPMVFKNVQITLMKKGEGEYCYAVHTIAEGKVLNRRQAFRCHVGLSTSIQCGSNHAVHDGVIKDVSITGFSVVAYNETEFYENQVIHVLLSDYLEELAENFSFHLYGIIVRKEEIDGGRFLYGCRLNNKVPGIDAYIMKKERLRIKKTMGGGSGAR